MRRRRALVVALATAVAVPLLAGFGYPSPYQPLVPRDGPTPVTPFPPPPAPRTLTVAVSGDVLPHTSVWQAAQREAQATGRAFDFRPLFAGLQLVVSAADLAICHLETPVAPPGEALSTYPLYGVPVEVVEGIATAGYDRCSTASNHSLDRGVRGIDATLAALDGAGLGHAGTARAPQEASPSVFTLREVKVAHLSYSFSFNGLRLPQGEPWRANLIDAGRILAEAAAARAAGAELVLVSLHWGTEYSSAVNQGQRDLAEALMASGEVDLVIGHHAHVVQPIEQVHGRWVLYGLGNSISGMRGSGRLPAATQDGAVVTVRFVEQADGGFVAEQPVVHPTWVEPVTKHIVAVLPALTDPATPPEARVALEASLARTRAVLGPFVAAG